MCRYSRSMKTIHNRYMHLTNYSINRHNAEYQNNTNDTARQGHKWLVFTFDYSIFFMMRLAFFNEYLSNYFTYFVGNQSVV